MIILEVAETMLKGQNQGCGSGRTLGDTGELDFTLFAPWGTIPGHASEAAKNCPREVDSGECANVRVPRFICR